MLAVWKTVLMERWAPKTHRNQVRLPLVREENPATDRAEIRLAPRRSLRSESIPIPTPLFPARVCAAEDGSPQGPTVATGSVNRWAPEKALAVPRSCGSRVFP